MRLRAWRDKRRGQVAQGAPMRLRGAHQQARFGRVRAGEGDGVLVALSRATMVRRTGIARWSVLGFLPVAFAGSLVLPTVEGLPVGTGEALACSGGDGPNYVPPSGWVWLKPSLLSNTPLTSVPIATDGFFVIDAEGTELPVEAAQSSMTVVVTDEAGAPVAGETKLLIDKQPGWYLFGWTASAPLEVGAKLTARLSASPIADPTTSNVGGSFPLVVAGSPTPFPEPELTFSAWLDFFQGSGDPVNCPAPIGYCGPFLSMPGRATKRDALEATWRLPPSSTGVAWRPRLEASPSSADAVLPTYFNEFLGVGPDQSFGTVAFPTAAEQYCVTLVVEDLRTHEEKRTELCAKPEPARQSYTNSELASCTEPPTPELTEAWCRVRDARNIAACERFFHDVVGVAGAGSGGSDAGVSDPGVAGSRPSGSGAQSGKGGQGASSAAGDSAESDFQPDESDVSKRTSKGCQVGAPGQATSGAAWLLAALVAALGRLRVAAASGASPRAARR